MSGIVANWFNAMKSTAKLPNYGLTPEKATSNEHSIFFFLSNFPHLTVFSHRVVQNRHVLLYISLVTVLFVETSLLCGILCSHLTWRWSYIRVPTVLKTLSWVVVVNNVHCFPIYSVCAHYVNVQCKINVLVTVNMWYCFSERGNVTRLLALFMFQTISFQTKVELRGFVHIVVDWYQNE